MINENEKQGSVAAPRKRAARAKRAAANETVYSIEPLESRMLLSVMPGPIFVGSSNAISAYSASGALENASLIPRPLDAPTDIAISGSDLFVINSGTNTIGEYTTSGATVNPSLISGITPFSIACLGSNLLVAEATPGVGANAIPTYTIAEYTSGGALVNPSLIAGPDGVVVSGSDIFVGNGTTISEYSSSGVMLKAALIPPSKYGIGTFTASGSDLFVSINHPEDETQTISEFTTAGAIVKASLMRGLPAVDELAFSGSYLFVLSGSINEDSTVAEYTTSGTAVNTTLLSGVPNLNQFNAIAVSGSDLFASSYYGNTVSEFTIYGQTVNVSLLSPPIVPTVMAASGSDLFVAQYDASDGLGGVGEYTTSGVTVNSSLIADLYQPQGIAVSGSDVFVTIGGIADNGGSIAEYSTSGQTINAALVTGLAGPNAIAVSGSDIFVLYDGVVGEYTTSGATVNAALIKDVGGGGIAIAGSDLFVYGLGTFGEYTTSGSTVNASLLTAAASPLDIAVALAGFGASGSFTDPERATDSTCVESPQTIGPPSQLAFGQRPIGATAEAIASPVTVAVEDANGNVITDDASDVTLSIASGPAGATMSGTATVSAQGGVATFNDLSFSQAGIYTLAASDGILSAGVSLAFHVNVAAGQSQLVPRFGQVNFPTLDLGGRVFTETAVAGALLRLKVPIVITNNGNPIAGAVTVDIYDNVETGLDGNQNLIATVTRHLRLGARASRAFNFTITALTGALPDRFYHLLVDVIDPTGADSEAATPQTVNIMPAYVVAGVSVGKVVPSSILAGKSGSVLVSINNQGDAAGVGVDIMLSPSADGMAPLAGIILDSVTSKITILPNQTRTFRLRFQPTSSLGAGSYSPYVSVSLGGIFTETAGTKQFEII